MIHKIKAEIDVIDLISGESEFSRIEIIKEIWLGITNEDNQKDVLRGLINIYKEAEQGENEREHILLAYNVILKDL